MPQSLNQKAVNNFIKGLITEAGEMTFPDGASVDELNCDLRRDGSRRRRLGAAKEVGSVLSTFSISDTDVITSGDWVNVAGNADLEFLVIQKGPTLYFYNKADLPHSDQEVPDSIDLTAYEHSGSAGAETAKCQFTSIKGNLVVSSPAIEAIAVEYDESAQTFSETQIDFLVRDFEWQGDTTTYYSDDSSPSNDRKYDAKNAGWASGNGAPSTLTKRLTHPWYSGKDADGNYSESEFNKIYAGTTLTGHGHFVLDFFTKDRGNVSGLSGLTKMTDVEPNRFRCVEAFSGRVFYAGLESPQNAGSILFSGLIETIADLGKCHQVNDPTAEYLSDLLDTDGGVIKIPDAVKIQKLYAYQSSLFVFADNGVWQITGVDGVFTASSFSVNRVSRVGLLQPDTFVSADGVPFWWSRFGIHTLQSDPVSGQGQEQNLTLNTIQSFWDKIDTDVKLKVTAAFDAINKRIYWAYPNNGEDVESKLNNFLILDIPLQAFYPWRIEDKLNDTDSVIGLAFYSGYGADSLELDVTANSGADDVVTSAGDDVVSEQISTFNTGDSAIVLLVRDGTTNKMTMGAFYNQGFLDWYSTNYVSFAETGYDFIGDAIVKKSAPYLVTYCRRTEAGFTGNETIGYEAIRPSGLTVASSWDFKSTFPTGQQVYRQKFPVVVDPNNLNDYNYPEDVITSRVKVRGTGRSMSLRYESEQGKDFQLIGWGMVQGRNNRF